MEKFRKYLFNEITFFIAILGVVVSAVLFISGPDAKLRQDIALIKQHITSIEDNDLKHISNDLKAFETQIAKNEQAINELDKKLIKIMVALDIEQ